MAYTEERRAFAQFKNALETNAQLKAEYEAAIASVLEEYNTSIYENRFVTGGAVEMFTMWAMRAGGIEIAQVGAQLSGGDLQLPRGGRVSVKGVFAAPPAGNRADGRSTNLINFRGTGGNAIWVEATFFLIAGRGLYYADPEVMQGKTHMGGDAVSIKMKDVVEFGAAHPRYQYKALEVPEKSALAAQSKVASRAVAFETVMSRNLTELQRGFPQP